MRNRYRPTQTVRNVLDGPWSQCHHCPSLLPAQRPIRGLLRGPPGMNLTSKSCTRSWCRLRPHWWSKQKTGSLVWLGMTILPSVANMALDQERGTCDQNPLARCWFGPIAHYHKTYARAARADCSEMFTEPGGSGAHTGSPWGCSAEPERTSTTSTIACHSR